jgi:predicted phage terminase large subunit-like protein
MELGPSTLTPVEKLFVKSDNYLYTRWRFFMMYGFNFERNWHFEIICRKLEDIFCGIQKKNIVINIPPGYGKSEIISIGMTAFGMGHDPSSKFIVTSYVVEVAETFTSQSKDILEEPWHLDVFPCAMDKSTSAKKFFKTKKKGEVLAAAVNSKVTGHRAGTGKPGFTGMIISDDPLKASDSNSEPKLAEATRFQDETLESRKFNDSVVKLIVMQRLSQKDPSGTMLSKGWDHLCLPAILNKEQLKHFCDEIGVHYKETDSYKQGDVEADEFPLWPWKLNLEKHRSDRGDYIEKGVAGIGSFVFSGQYMQKPSPDGGGIIKLDWIRHYSVLPDNIQYKIITADTAWDEKTRNDYNVLQCWGYTSTGIYLIDQIRKKCQFPELKRIARTFYQKHRPRYFCVENKQSGIALFQELRAEMMPVKKLKAQTCKIARAHDAAPWIELGFVYIPEKNMYPWVQVLLDEIETFPVGNHDDQVDTLVYAVKKLCTENTFETPTGLVAPTKKELAAELRKTKQPNNQNQKTNPWLEATGLS